MDDLDRRAFPGSIPYPDGLDRITLPVQYAPNLRFPEAATFVQLFPCFKTANAIAARVNPGATRSRTVLPWSCSMESAPYNLKAAAGLAKRNHAVAV